MVKLLRKGPVCPGILHDGSSCEARVERAGERCRVCLERLATSPDAEIRLEVAGYAELPVAVFELLGDDPEPEVRLTVAHRDDCPLIVLQRLEGDEDAGVRSAATAALSSALSPRLLDQTEREGLFTRAEVEALGQGETSGDEDPFGAPQRREVKTPGRVRRVDHGGDRTTARRPEARDGRRPEARDGGRPEARDGRRPDAGADRRSDPVAAAASMAGFEAVLSRLEAIGDRLSSLESALTSTGERLGVISDRLDELAEAPPRPVAVGPASMAALVDATVSDGSGALLPVPCPAALDTGPVIRADIVAAAWLAVIPLLARRRAAGIRVSAASFATEQVAGPLLDPRPLVVAELSRPVCAELNPVATANPVTLVDAPPAGADVAPSAGADARPRSAKADTPRSSAGRRKPLHAKRH